MNLRRICVGLMGWLLLSPMGAQACQLAKLPDIKVRVVPWQVQENYQYSQSELARLVTRQPWLTQEHATRGVYSATLMHRKRMTFDTRNANVMGDICTGINELEVELSFSNPTIYLARELAWARCVANATRDHEQKHAARDKQLLADFATTLQRGLDGLVITTKPLSGDAGEAENTWNKQVDAYIAEAITKFTETRNKAQKAIDSRDEYARLDAACPHN